MLAFVSKVLGLKVWATISAKVLNFRGFQFIILSLTTHLCFPFCGHHIVCRFDVRAGKLDSISLSSEVF